MSPPTCDLVFVTQDTESEKSALNTTAEVILSRVPQHLRIADRVELWGSAIDAFVCDAPSGRLFEPLPNGVLVPLPE